MPKIKISKDYEFFWGKEARIDKSPARQLVESASSEFSDFENRFKTKIICLALALGGSTLKMLTNSLSDSDDKNVRIVKEMVSHLLVEIFAFSEIYSKWLPEHLEHLNQGSIMILKDLKSDDFELVRYSTVV